MKFCQFSVCLFLAGCVTSVESDDDVEPVDAGEAVDEEDDGQEFPTIAASRPITGGLWYSHADYDYSPSYMVDQFDGNKGKAWWCGRGPSGDDVIYYIERRNTRSPWSSPRIVFKHDSSSASWEGVHTCDVSVTRGRFPVSGKVYSYALYFTTDSPTNPTNNNKIGVAFSTNGTTWTRYPLPLVKSIYPNNTAYGAGQQVAYSANAGAAVHMVHTDISPSGAVNFFYRYAPDGIHFGSHKAISQKGLGLISYRNPAIAFAPSNSYYYLAKVAKVYPDYTAKRIAIYRIRKGKLFTGTWTRVAISSGIKPVELEPGFKTDAYGNVQKFLPKISAIFACSGDGAPSTWELCYGTAKL